MLLVSGIRLVQTGLSRGGGQPVPRRGRTAQAKRDNARLQMAALKRQKKRKRKTRGLLGAILRKLEERK